MTEPAPVEPLVFGSIVDSGGVARAKAVPADRLDEFARVGMGASPSWNVFCVDDQLAFTDRFNVVGDLRLRIDPEALRSLGDGVQWAPATIHTQDGATSPACTRSALERTVDRLAADGITARVGHELEFTLFDGVPVPQWSAYGLGAALDQREFLQSVLARAWIADLGIAQVHAEFGANQFEISLQALPPVEAADALVLARTVISQAAREHSMAASFSPLPAEGGAGNGAHLHLSLTTGDAPVFEGGGRGHGLTDAGAAAIGGILAALPDLMGALASSALSATRMQPGMWSGAWCCWGTENREAAVRLIEGGPGAAGGANLEVKCMDASANPYAATAVLLEAARAGIRDGAALPPEVTVNPASADPAPALLPTDGPDQLVRLARSPIAGTALGAWIIEAVGAVRSLEHATYADTPLAETAERLRYAWTN